MFSKNLKILYLKLIFNNGFRLLKVKIKFKK
jgi:hypothetical protein